MVEDGIFRLPNLSNTFAKWFELEGPSSLLEV